MSDYTPSIQELARAYEAVFVEARRPEARAEAARAIVAHDAEKRAEWEAEQGETEWEYECRIPPFDWKTCTDDPRFCPKGSDRRRRREAGTWLPVPDTTNSESEGEGMSEKRAKPTTPGSVIQIDTLLMRTRWDNWVSDAGFIVEDAEVEGMAFILLFDAAESTRYWFEAEVRSTDTTNETGEDR